MPVTASVTAMPGFVIPFHGAGGKTRLDTLGAQARAVLAHAMASDVAAACRALGSVVVVAPEDPQLAGTVFVPDPGGGQGAAVATGLAAVTSLSDDRVAVVVNADVPCVTTADLTVLIEALAGHAIAYAPAADGTTNALALADASVFAPLYGPGSAARFAALAQSVAVTLPNLVDDVDTPADLMRLAGRLGVATRLTLKEPGMIGEAA